MAKYGTQIEEAPNGARITSFPTRAEAITPSDTTEYELGRTVYVGTGGDVAVEPLYGGNTLTFTVSSNEYVPVVVRRVLATGTTASGMVGLY